MPIPQLSIKKQSQHRGWKASRRPPLKRGSISKKKLYQLVWLFGSTGLLLIIGFLIVVVGNLPDPKKIIERHVPESTTIYDRTGEHVLFELFSDVKRTQLKLEDIPIYVQQATLVAEDRDFYTHHGFKLTSLIRATLINTIKLNPTSQGGSTITQQFVKNAILTPEKTYIRKLKELILAYRIEKKFTKQQILTLYFNEIPYGSTAYGIEAASQTYFGKHARELTVAEGALLAALPKAPTFYSPYGSNQKLLINRQHHILNGMVDEGYLTKKEAMAAKEEKLIFKPQHENIRAPHFVFYLKEQLALKYGERLVEQGGLKIISTIDLEKQGLAENIITERAESNSTNFNAHNAALVALDPKTGQILAMVGSRDYFDTENDGNVNVTTRPRQPGSSFKPVVYAAAFTKGYTPETKLFDVETVFKTDLEDYAPKNYDKKEHGLVSVRQALAGSLNIPSVKLLYLTGLDNVLALAESLGYTTFKDKSRFGLSLVLGGGEVTLLEHTAAFGAFARDGAWHKPTGILKIEDATGKVIEEYEEKSKRVVDTNVSRTINSILSDNNARAFVFGTQNHLTLPDRPVAAKTGTTNSFIDAWTVGYTPSLVTGVWVGNNDNTPMRKGAAGGQVAAPIWQRFMREALHDTPVESFTPPVKKKVSNPALRGKNVGETTVTIDRISGKLATDTTPEEFRLKKMFFSGHSILFYVNKNNPNGPPPDNPGSDPQFTNWESAIRAWAEKNDFLLEEPPTKFDDVHVPEKFPKITITSPQKNQKITNASITITTKTIPKGNPIQFVDYEIDGRPVGRSQSFPFNLTLNLVDFINGWHTLSAEVNDSVGNRSTDTITFSLSLTRTEPALLWIQPVNQTVLTLDEFPISVKFLTATPERITSVTIKAVNLVTKKETILSSERTLDDSNEQEIVWQRDAVAPSTWQLVAGVKNSDGDIQTKLGPTVLINPAIEQTEE